MRKPFPGTATYWECRYRSGGDSGAGSSGELAQYKANFLNKFVKENKIESVIDWGCGDGDQLRLAKYPHYIGLDVSKTAIEICKKKYTGDHTKKFECLENNSSKWSAELSLSLDVLYHLIEDKTYTDYLHALFASADRSVIIYSVNTSSGNYAAHVKPRVFTEDLQKTFPQWQCILHEANPFPLSKYGPEKGSWSDFYVYQRTN
ncbi:MAG: class I SAM-dependent methyltransferase [Flavobacteriales bacterium]|nr:class I SAM-dependent methyltransferase [Flavobacteriales bacterium]